jgi:hypothetical protein
MIEILSTRPPLDDREEDAMTTPTRFPRREPREVEDTLVPIRAALARLKYGAITLTVHDGRLVQIDVTEKLRFGA